MLALDRNTKSKLISLCTLLNVQRSVYCALCNDDASIEKFLRVAHTTHSPHTIKNTYEYV